MSKGQEERSTDDQQSFNNFKKSFQLGPIGLEMKPGLARVNIMQPK